MNPLERLEALKETYRQELPEKYSQVQSLYDAALHDGLDDASFASLYRLVHNLIGSGATFGLLEVSEAARAFDGLLKPFVLEEQLPSSSELEGFRPFMDALASVCQSHSLSSDDDASSSSSDASSFTVEKVAKKSRDIYLIEKDSDLNRELTTQLENFGYPVKSFFDLDSLEEALPQKMPDTVLMDELFLQDDESMERITRIFKHSSQSPSLFIISGEDDFITRINAIRSGCDAFITKPVNITSLVARLDRLSKRGPSAVIRVLLVDDDPTIAQYHSSLLQAGGMQTRYITSPEAVLEAMAAYQPDVVLTDFYMPDFNGLEVAKVIRQMDEYFSIPIIYISVESDDSIHSEAIGVGGEDFLVKPVDPQILLRTVSVRAERYRYMREQIQHDSLTGLYNHTASTTMLAKAIADANRYGYVLSFAMIDIDHFKQVNDIYGHQIGDVVLQTLSHLLIQRVRGTDIVGRYGGEEFSVILPHAIEENAFKLLDEIRIKFSEIVYERDGKEFQTTFSCGICEWEKGMDASLLIEHADQAMYEAKNGGRDKVVRCGHKNGSQTHE